MCTERSVRSHLHCHSLGAVGFLVPPWEELLDEGKEPQVEEEVDPTQPRRGWQRKATMAVDVFSANTRSSQLLRTPRLPFSGPRPVQWRLLHSWPFLHRRRPVSTLSHFGSSSCAHCGSPCLFMRAPAGVAVPSTSLATTVQHAQMQGSWSDVVGCWRMLLPVSAGKLGAA